MMYRCIAAGIGGFHKGERAHKSCASLLLAGHIACEIGLVLLPTMAAFPAQKPAPARSASVKLWLDTTSGSPCETATPASGGWTIRNNEDRNVRVTVHRTMTRSGVTKEDQMRDTLAPGESRDLGCEVSDEGQQTLTLVRAIY